MSDEEIGSLVAISRSRTEPGGTRANAARLSRAPVVFAVGKRLGVIIKRSTNCGRRGCWRVTRGEHGPAAGDECLAHLAQGTVCKILAQEEIKWLLLFSEAVKLIDRLGGRLRQIAEIEIGCDTAAHIGPGEAELRPLLGDIDSRLHVNPVLQCGVLECLLDKFLAHTDVLGCNFDRLVPVLQVLFFKIEVRLEEIYCRLPVFQKVGIGAEQLVAGAKLGG